MTCITQLHYIRQISRPNWEWREKKVNRNAYSFYMIFSKLLGWWEINSVTSNEWKKNKFFSCIFFSFEFAASSTNATTSYAIKFIKSTMLECFWTEIYDQMEWWWWCESVGWLLSNQESQNLLIIVLISLNYDYYHLKTSNWSSESTSLLFVL